LTRKQTRNKPSANAAPAALRKSGGSLQQIIFQLQSRLEDEFPPTTARHLRAAAGERISTKFGLEPDAGKLFNQAKVATSHGRFKYISQCRRSFV
jgi:hypothetical protein